MISRGGAESGGVAQLPNGDVVAIFNQIGGGGHWQARPVDIEDPHLVEWTDRNPDGSACKPSGKCKATPGIPGTDLSQAFKINPDDEYWRVIADRPDASGEKGAALVAKTKNFTSFEIEGTFHEYKWNRCVALPSLCGFGPYPRDPNAFLIPNTKVWVFYGMQKTCSFSGREFYALGTYDAPGSFAVLDARSDYANNVWDGGEGYASMHVHDPLNNRILWLPAIIEGDRDPCGDKTGEGFWRSWLASRSIGSGWFGTLGLPRVVHLDNLTSFVPRNNSFVRLRTPPLPELAQLRQRGVHISGIASPDRDIIVEAIRGQSIELVINVSASLLESDEFDFGARVLWSDDGSEYTKVGIRGGKYLPGIDLYDEINGDAISLNTSSVTSCREACMRSAVCTAWTFSAYKETDATGLCRMKEYAHHALQVASSNGAFQPYTPGSTSGYISTGDLKYASLYIDRTKSTTATDKTYGAYPNFNYSMMLPIIASDINVSLHIFCDGSIVEAFAQDGRAATTGRVYPANPTSDRISVYSSRESLPINADVFTVSSALVSDDADPPFVDMRNISANPVILTEGYTDQPYCSIIDWKSKERFVCVVTISSGGEGSFGEHCVSVYSDDGGVTWSSPKSIELPDGTSTGVPNAYATIVATKRPRLYTIYNYNAHNVTMSGRNDELGFFYMKWSDDAGETWSSDRILVPYPQTWIDRNNNPFKGKVNIMWTVDQIKTSKDDGAVYFAFTKIGAYVQNPPEEIFVMKSENLLTAEDPHDIKWTMLPEDSDHGVECLFGENCNVTVNEEGHVLPIQHEDISVVMARTSTGYLSALTLSRDLKAKDGNRRSHPAQYWNNTVSENVLVPIAGGVKHPRGPFTPKEIMPNVFFMLFYNNAGSGRNPYWLSCGRWNGKTILWSQPEIVLYDKEYHGGTSGGGYPDMHYRNGRLILTVAQKGLPQPAKSRVFLATVSTDVVSGLLKQHNSRGMPLKPIIELTTTEPNASMIPSLPATGKVAKYAQQGFTVELLVNDFASYEVGDALIFGDFMSVVVADGRLLELMFTDSTNIFRSTMDSACAALLITGARNQAHHVSIVADGGPGISFFVVDGVLCDGSWKWVPEGMEKIPSGNLNLGRASRARLFDRAFRTSQVVSMFRLYRDQETSITNAIKDYFPLISIAFSVLLFAFIYVAWREDVREALEEAGCDISHDLEKVLLPDSETGVVIDAKVKKERHNKVFKRWGAALISLGLGGGFAPSITKAIIHSHVWEVGTDSPHTDVDAWLYIHICGGIIWGAAIVSQLISGGSHHTRVQTCHRVIGWIGAVCLLVGVAFAGGLVWTVHYDFCVKESLSIGAGVYTIILAVAASANIIQAVRYARMRDFPSHKDSALMAIMWTMDPAVHRSFMWLLHIVCYSCFSPASFVGRSDTLNVISKMPANVVLFVWCFCIMIHARRVNKTLIINGSGQYVLFAIQVANGLSKM